MATKQFITMDVKGIEEYLKKVEQAGKNIDVVVKDAIEQSTAPIHADIQTWVNKHRLTGATAAGLIKPEAKQSGNEISAQVGISGEGESWHSVFVEYGTPRQSADPGIRTAFETKAAEVKKIQRKVLKEAGVPVDG
jgi:HK97 gp10 family phage protein